MMTNYSQEENSVAATAIFKMKVQQTMERIDFSESLISAMRIIRIFAFS